jgi:hypothetical protein
MRTRSLLAALLLAAVLSGVLIAGAPAAASAQCALCAKNAEFAGVRPGDGSRVFARAAVVLLVPVLGAATALGVWVRRHGTR